MLGEPRRVVGTGLVLLLFLPRVALARVDIEIDYVDANGEGFFDETEVAPDGGNPGTTLGEQRRLAFERALGIWGVALDSDVPVVVEATFAPIPELPCEMDSAVLGAARSEAVFAGFPGAPRGDLFYPAALADKLAGEDLDPGQPDISALFNPRLDDAECLGELSWDYGFDERASETGFVSTVLHELAHGLGFASLVDELSGEASDGLSVFESMMFDRATGLTWDVMTNDQRRNSASEPYGLVWLGERVTETAPSVLARGAPLVEVSNGQVLQVVSEPSFPPFIEEALSGSLLYLEPREACQGDSDLSGRIVLLEVDARCPDVVRELSRATQRGAVAALTRSLVPGEPPFGVAADPRGSPVVSLALSQDDFDGLRDSLAAVELTATLSPDGRLVGADEEGRVRLAANRPVLPGSSTSHWDSSVRRQVSDRDDPVVLLMEPTAGGNLHHEVSDLSVQLLQDLGWGGAVCGNGVVEDGETCDRGIENSDAVADACRLDCSPARCGDGVLDVGESCEPGLTPESCGDDCRPGAVGEPEPQAEGDAAPPRRDAAAPLDATDRSKPDAAPPPRGPLAAEGCGCAIVAVRAPSQTLWLALLPLVLMARRRARRVPLAPSVPALCGRS